MADRLTELVLGLQRMAENARLRGDDLRYTQQQETYEHISWLDQQLQMVEKVRAVFLEERRKFMPVEREQHEPMPRIVTKGPTTATAVAQIKKVERDEQQRSTPDHQAQANS